MTTKTWVCVVVATLLAGALSGISIAEVQSVNNEQIISELQHLNLSAYPSLSDEELGLLHFMYRKATQPPDEQYSFEPTDSKGYGFVGGGNLGVIYDATFSSHATALAANKTPAYREIYKVILDGFIQRLIDRKTWEYWTENAGNERNDGSISPYNPDPIAWANVQYSGYFDTVLGLYELLTNDHKYDQDFDLRYDKNGKNLRFTYNHKKVTEAIYFQMRDNNTHGVFCEADQIFLLCNMLTSMGLVAYDTAHAGSNYGHIVTDEGGWLDWARENFVVPPRKTGLPPLVVYAYYKYLPEVKTYVPVGLPVGVADLGHAAYTHPVDAAFGRDMYEMAKLKWAVYEADGTAWFRQTLGASNILWEQMGLPANEKVIDSANEVGQGGDSAWVALGDAEATAYGLLAAKEVGDIAMYEKVKKWIDKHYQPRWDDEHNTFMYHLYHEASKDSRFKKSVINAVILMATAGTSNGLANVVKLDDSRFSQPTLRDIIDDYPRTKVSTAYFDKERSALILQLTVSSEAASFTIANLPPLSRVVVIEDGGPGTGQDVDNGGNIKLTATQGHHSFVIWQGE